MQHIAQLPPDCCTNNPLQVLNETRLLTHYITLTQHHLSGVSDYKDAWQALSGNNFTM